VKLVLKAPGMATQELTLTAEDLAQPVRVVLSSAGATIAGSGSSNFINSAATPCFSFYRALIAFATSELGVARADYNDNKLAEARTRYENLIKQLDIPGAENLREVPLFRTAARTALGDIAFKEGRYADAARLYKEAIDGANKDKRPDLLWAAQRGLGRSLWQQSLASPDSKDNVQLRNDSFLAYQQALKTIEMLRAGSLRADDARSTFLANTKDVYDEAAAILANMALLAAGPKAKDDAATKAVTVNTANRGFASDGYNTIEHGRARSLLEMLAESQASITQGVPADLIKRRDEIIQRQKEIADTLMGISLPGSGLQKTVPDLEDELDRLEIEYNGLENQIRTSNPRYASLTGAEPMPMSQVQQKVLDDKTVLLLYSLGADQSFLWVVTPQGLAISRLPARATIEDQVLKLRSQMIPGAGQRGLAGIDLASDTTRSLDLEPDSKAPSPAGTTQALNAGAYATAANDLYNTILKPAESLIQGKRLLVVPDGALNYTPFEALVTAPPSGTASYATLSYLVTTNEVAYAPSASVISEVRQQSQQARAAAGSARTDEMLIVADPVFSSSDVRLKLDATSAKVSTAAPASTQPENTRELTLDAAVSDVVGPTPASGLKIPRLVNTRTEAQDIGKLIIANKAKADIWLDLDASENNLLTRDVRSYRILHFATHGLLNTEHPQFTGIVLSLVGDQQDDGFLRVNEIFNLRLGAPLVMLSACETGLGREKRGEGIIGLTRAFMYAGAPTVGVSLWAVADRSTARLMTDFYEGYLGTSTATATGALRDAKLKMISSQQFSAPFYWAPFVIIGDWSRTWQ
jgi:CHAT domain-containing protein